MPAGIEKIDHLLHLRNLFDHNRREMLPILVRDLSRQRHDPPRTFDPHRLLREFGAGCDCRNYLRLEWLRGTLSPLPRLELLTGPSRALKALYDALVEGVLAVTIRIVRKVIDGGMLGLVSAEDPVKEGTGMRPLHVDLLSCGPFRLPGEPWGDS
jgi:hypothetical protein